MATFTAGNTYWDLNISCHRLHAHYNVVLPMYYEGDIVIYICVTIAEHYDVMLIIGIMKSCTYIK